MAQTTKSLVRRQAHDITLAQHIHYACLVFHNLTGTNTPTITPIPSLDPKPQLKEALKKNCCADNKMLCSCGGNN